MKFRHAAGLSVTLACFGGAAHGAETVHAMFNSVTPGVGCQFSTDSGVSWTGTLAGSMNWTRDAGDPGTYAGLQGNFSTFCIEVTQRVAFGGTYMFDVTNTPDAPTPDINFDLPMGNAKAVHLSELFGRYRNGLSGDSDFGAFQMAVWEIVYENAANPLNVDTGIFRIQGAATEQGMANNWLASLDGTGPMMGGLFALSNREYQDQIVPAPSAFALLGLGGLAASRRRRC